MLLDSVLQRRSRDYARVQSALPAPLAHEQRRSVGVYRVVQFRAPACISFAAWAEVLAEEIPAQSPNKAVEPTALRPCMFDAQLVELSFSQFHSLTPFLRAVAHLGRSASRCRRQIVHRPTSNVTTIRSPLTNPGGWTLTVLLGSLSRPTALTAVHRQ